MLEGVHQVFLGPQDMRDAHVMVVDDDGEVIGGKAVGLADDDVVMLVRLDGHIAQNQVLNGDVFVRHGEAHHRG